VDEEDVESDLLNGDNVDIVLLVEDDVVDDIVAGSR
jgi:hypothetical protein